MDDSPIPQDSGSSPIPPPRRSLRWKPLVVIFALRAAAAAFIALAPELLGGMQVVASMAAIAASGLALLIWFWFFSGISRRGVWLGTSLLLLAGLITASLVRIDGFDGAMLPLLAWRWTPTAEERFAASRPAQPSAAEPAQVNLVPAGSGDFPGYLGDKRLGVVENLRLNADWTSQAPKLLWRQPIGLGWSAFAVVGDFAITQEQRGEQEAVVCYEVATGRERWAHTDKARFSEALGGDGPRATPTIHEGRVYALGATGILNCLDGGTGQKLWSRNILEDAGAENISWGMAGSPLVVGQTVVVSAGGKPDHSLLAYRLDSGELAWHAGDDPAAYASPMLTRLDGIEQILIYNAAAIVGHDPASGEVLWRYPWKEEQVIKCAQPVVLGDFGEEQQNRVLLSSGYAIGSVLLEVERVDGRFEAAPVWETRQLRAKFANMLVRDGYVYGLDEGILTCLDLADGSRQWKQGRYGHGQMLLVGDLLLIQAEGGDVALVEASPKRYREVARLPALTSKTWNPPALAGKRLLVRNDREAMCFELPTLSMARTVRQAKR